jgi:hypothetical protein
MVRGRWRRQPVGLGGCVRILGLVVFLRRKLLLRHCRMWGMRLVLREAVLRREEKGKNRANRKCAAEGK